MNQLHKCCYLFPFSRNNFSNIEIIIFMKYFADDQNHLGFLLSLWKISPILKKKKVPVNCRVQSFLNALNQVY